MKRQLRITAPPMRGKDVRYARRLLRRNTFKTDFLGERIDPAVWEEAAADGTRRAKFELGYPPGKINGAFGTVLERYLRGDDPLPATYAARRKKRLAPKPRPWASIGPVTRGGRSLLDHSLTHQTHGLPKNAEGRTLWPAVDSAWGSGTTVIAPEDCVVDTRDTSARPGEALYLTGDSGMRYWIAHIDRDYQLGRRFKKGDLLGLTVATTIGGGPHGHFGVNGEAFLGKGKQFLYGEDGDGPDYTFGSPTIREQLAAAA